MNRSSEERISEENSDRLARGELAAGVKVFTRTASLDRLLQSIPGDLISRVYVADDGPEECKRERSERLYDREYPFKLEVLNLPYDTGVGYGRSRIVEEFTEEYLLMLDSDVEVPGNLAVLAEVLEARPDLGGVSGRLAEPPYNRIVTLAADFETRDTTVTLSPFLQEKDIEFVEGHSLVSFDFVPNLSLFRRECLETYAWDPNYVMEHDHLDFFFGHWKNATWSFAVCPEVIFPHYPGGDVEYQKRRWDEPTMAAAEEYFLEKWGYDDLEIVEYYWSDGGRLPREESTLHTAASMLDAAASVYADDGPLGLAKRSASFLGDRFRR